MRKTIKGAVVCYHNDEQIKFITAPCTLYKKLKVINSSTIWCPRHVGKYDNWVGADQIPLCYASMSSHVITFGGMRTYRKKETLAPVQKVR